MYLRKIKKEPEEPELKKNLGLLEAVKIEIVGEIREKKAILRYILIYIYIYLYI